MAERYRRQIVFLDDRMTTAWADLARRAVEPPPGLQQIIGDKIAEHGQNAVSKAIGLAWETCRKLRDGDFTIAPTIGTFWAHRPRLAQLDVEADARYAAEEAARAVTDARRDEAQDAKSGRGHR
jgi:hypothetical protein